MDVFFPFIYQKKNQKDDREPAFLYIENEIPPQEESEEKEEERVIILEL